MLLLDTADCAGGGAAGDSIQLVKALLDAGAGATPAEKCVAMVVDADAAAQCVAAGAGAEVALELGHTIDSSAARAAAGLPPWGAPLKTTGRVVAVKADATFGYTGGLLGGSTVSMGATAVWVVGGAIHVLIMTTATYDWADEQYRCMGIDPKGCKFIAVKNMMNFRYNSSSTLYSKLQTNTRYLPFSPLSRRNFTVIMLTSHARVSSVSSLEGMGTRQ